MANESQIQDNQEELTNDKAILLLHGELEDLKEQFDSFIKDYKNFTAVTNETVLNMLQFLFQYLSLVESLYSNLIKNDLVSKLDLDSTLEDIYNEMIQNLQLEDDDRDIN